MAPSKAPLRVGVLGAAGIARKNVRAILLASESGEPRLTVVAVGSRSQEKAEAFIKDNGLEGKAKACTYEQVLADPTIDAVYMPLPTGLHVEWMRKAAAAGKHVLLEKPVALDAADLEAIASCMRDAKLVWMDGTMWSHSPRVIEMEKALQQIGRPHDVKATFTIRGNPDFIANNIRVKKDLDGLGSLGDLGWYCVRAALWAMAWQVPEEVVAHSGCVYNDEGVVIDGGATLLWPHEAGEGLSSPRRIATIHYSFQQAMCQDLCVTGPKGSLRLSDFVIPHNETRGELSVTSVDGFGLTPIANGTTLETVTTKVDLAEPQEVSMWRAFARCVHASRAPGAKPAAAGAQPAYGSIEWWAKVAQDTQRVVHAIATSLKQDCKVVKV